jgi:transcriptional regulator GlxA family with amidase domain
MAEVEFRRLIGTLSRAYTEMNPKQGGDVLQIAEAIAHLERHWSESVPIAELTRIAHRSESSLLRAFKASVGCSPSEYHIGLRIERAKALLRSSSLTVTEIAFRTGHRDSNYFSRLFRRKTGQTPREYRERTD